MHDVAVGSTAIATGAVGVWNDGAVPAAQHVHAASKRKNQQPAQPATCGQSDERRRAGMSGRRRGWGTTAATAVWLVALLVARRIGIPYCSAL